MTSVCGECSVELDECVYVDSYGCAYHQCCYTMVVKQCNKCGKSGRDRKVLDIDECYYCEECYGVAKRMYERYLDEAYTEITKERDE